MKSVFTPILLVAVTALSFAARVSGDNPSTVPIAALKQVETITDGRFSSDPWNMLGYTRGTYLPGYGAVFTFEMSLVTVTPISPFHPTVTPEEIKNVHDRKIKQLAILKDTMRDLVVKAAASLTTLPPSEQIVFEAHLLGQSYEDHTGLPWRLTMISANRQKILGAVASHATPAEMAALIEERKE